MKPQEPIKLRSRGRGKIEEKPDVNPYLALAQEIVYQAVVDWYTLDAGRYLYQVSYESLCDFFNSPWCENLLLFTGINPEAIVRELKKHTREANK